MWGWRIRIGDLFSADYTPIPPQYLWKKKITKEGEETNSTAFGIAYQSVLSNITWIDKGNSSPFIQKLQRAMNQVNISGKDLSIRFNLDMYETYSRKNTFTTGRITGISFFRLFILGKECNHYFFLFSPLHSASLCFTSFVFCGVNFRHFLTTLLTNNDKEPVKKAKKFFSRPFFLSSSKLFALYTNRMEKMS